MSPTDEDPARETGSLSRPGSDRTTLADIEPVAERTLASGITIEHYGNGILRIRQQPNTITSNVWVEEDETEEFIQTLRGMTEE